MAHYGMLRDYQFSDDVDDIRGATIYAADQAKLGKVEDVVFDHDSGAVAYLVADLGHGAKVLVPSDHVFRAVTDEDSFQTDLSSDEARRLPGFNESKLREERQWHAHQEEQSRVWREHEKKLRDEYERSWHEAPVQHRPGSDRNITPEPAEAPADGRQVSAAELFPEPLASKFPTAARPMTTPSTNQSAPQIALNPGGATQRAAEGTAGSLPTSDRWSGFAESVRTHLENIRERCPICCGGQTQAA